MFDYEYPGALQLELSTDQQSLESHYRLHLEIASLSILPVQLIYENTRYGTSLG